MELGCGHRVCLTLVVLGMILQTAMFCAPYWSRVDVVGNLYSSSMGPIISCSQPSFLDQNHCQVIRFDRNFSWFEVFRWVAGAGAVLGLILTFSLCCVLCCNSDSTVVCQGVAVFISEGLCVGGAALFAARYKDLALTRIPMNNPELDWAFYTFIVNAGLLVLFSVVICCLPRVARLDVHPV